MQSIRPFMLAGAAALALGAATPALAAHPHVMTVPLPDGATVRISYYGDFPPQVAMVPAPPPAFAADVALPLADLDQLADMLDRQADAIMREAAQMAQLPGARVFSVYEDITSDGDCVRRTEITYGAGSPTPRQIDSATGNCAGHPLVHARTPTRRSQPRPDLILAHSERAHSNTPLIRDAVWQRSP
jgi:hypothetical protein